MRRLGLAVRFATHVATASSARSSHTRIVATTCTVTLSTLNTFTPRTL